MFGNREKDKAYQKVHRYQFREVLLQKEIVEERGKKQPDAEVIEYSPHENCFRHHGSPRGILPSNLNHSWTVTVDKRKTTEYLGLAIANPGPKQLEILFEFYQGGSLVPGTGVVRENLRPKGHYAGFVHELFPVSFSGVGTLRMSCAADRFSAVALRLDGSQFSSLPADAGTQMWSYTFTDSHGATWNGTWSWRFLDGYGFFGFEADWWMTGPAPIRGVLAENDFLLVWGYGVSEVEGTLVFRGQPPVREGDKDVIFGKRTKPKVDGTADESCTFNATRVY